MHEQAPARRFPAADGVRGFAVLVVVIHNSAWIGRSGASFPLKLTHAIAAGGWTGVELFVVLSGFLITGILVDSVGSPRYFRNFYLRRTLRIFPLYYSVLILALFVVPHLVAARGWTAAARRGGPITLFFKLAAYLACVLVLSTLLALVSWRVLEKPCLELKDRIAPRSPSPQPG